MAKSLSLNLTSYCFWFRDLCNYYVSQRMASDADPLVWISSKDSVEGMMGKVVRMALSFNINVVDIC